MAAKVNFNSVTKEIEVTIAPVLDNGDMVVDIDIKIDVYSDGKEDWLIDPILNKFRFPVNTAGGDDLPGSKSLGTTFFLEDGWKIKPFEQDHTFRVNGNLFSRDGSSPFVFTTGAFNVQIIQSVSNLVDSTVQQLPEIQRMAFQNAVWVDTVTGTAGTAYPIGTNEVPADNVADAVAIANSRGFRKLQILSSPLTLDSGDNVDEFEIVGVDKKKTTIIVNTGASTVNTHFTELHLMGVLDGGASLERCLIAGGLTWIYGDMVECVLSVGDIILAGSMTAYVMNSVTANPSDGIPTFDFGGAGQGLIARSYDGAMNLKNKSGTDGVVLGFEAGTITIEPTVTNGIIKIEGDAEIINNGTATIDNNTVANKVWLQPKTGYTDSDNMGGWINNTLRILKSLNS